eukprot:TRINITY_DN15924_c0_g1_i1.p1 TRINITY_DN15924_c0_g1~~TRINITY_DN15924_c0_g1_i1.p1  ORF type:complete len:725 (+),score=219.89 TRINITY_DN15924_c0_g1_i1:148-2322(+)
MRIPPLQPPPPPARPPPQPAPQLEPVLAQPVVSTPEYILLHANDHDTVPAFSLGPSAVGGAAAAAARPLHGGVVQSLGSGVVRRQCSVAALYYDFDYVKGKLPSVSNSLKELAIIQRTVDGADAFFICLKSRVAVTSALYPQHISEKRFLTCCPDYPGGCRRGSSCRKAHVDASGWEVPLPPLGRDVEGLRLLVVDRHDKALFHADAGEVDCDSLGIRCAVALQRDPNLAPYKAARMFLCQDHYKRKGGCPRGLQCPYVHYTHSKIQARHICEFPPSIAAADLLDTKLVLLLGKPPEGSTEHRRAMDFARRLRDEHYVHTVGDLNLLSSEVFEFTAGCAQPDDEDLWGLLAVMRMMPPMLSVRGALAKFPPLASGMADALMASPIYGPNGRAEADPISRSLDVLNERGVQTMSDLRKFSARELIELPVPASVKGWLQRIRNRDPDDDAESFAVFAIDDIRAGAQQGDPTDSYLCRAVDELLACKGTTHPSWRKASQGGKNMTVTTVISYAERCKCKAGPQHPGVTLGQRRLPPGPERHTPYQPPPARARSSGGSSAGGDPGGSPFYGGGRQAGGQGGSERQRRLRQRAGWCRCEKKTVVSVNYELSTPAGSRCSEQNGLGRISALPGVPISAIRDVFVHGQCAGPEPNPLFPCGVCEQMFRRLTGEVKRAHGADINLFMFDAQNAPRKLIYMPFSEISSRSGGRFQQFLESEVRGMVTQQGAAC